MRRMSVLAIVLAAGVMAHCLSASASPLQISPATQSPTTRTTTQSTTTAAQGGYGFPFPPATGSGHPTVSVTYADLVASGGAPAGREVAAVRARTCEMWAAPGGPESMGTENRPLAPVVGGLVDGGWYYQTCRYADTGALASSRYWQYE